VSKRERQREREQGRQRERELVGVRKKERGGERESKKERGLANINTNTHTHTHTHTAYVWDLMSFIETCYKKATGATVLYSSAHTHTVFLPALWVGNTQDMDKATDVRVPCGHRGGPL